MRSRIEGITVSHGSSAARQADAAQRDRCSAKYKVPNEFASCCHRSLLESRMKSNKHVIYLCSSVSIVPNCFCHAG